MGLSQRNLSIQNINIKHFLNFMITISFPCLSSELSLLKAVHVLPNWLSFEYGRNRISNSIQIDDNTKRVRISFSFPTICRFTTDFLYVRLDKVFNVIWTQIDALWEKGKNDECKMLNWDLTKKQILYMQNSRKVEAQADWVVCNYLV